MVLESALDRLKHLSPANKRRASENAPLSSLSFKLYSPGFRFDLTFENPDPDSITVVIPRFVSNPSSSHDGYDLWETTLTCNIFGYPPPKITWTRGHNSLLSERTTQAGRRLIIRKTARADAGPYMCKGINQFGSVFALIALKVHPVIPPVIVKPLPPLYRIQKVDDPLELSCAARGSPVPTVEWFKDGVPLSANETSKLGSQREGRLVIKSFKLGQQGSYRCFFRNFDNGTAESVTKVELVGCGDPGTPSRGYRIGEEFWAGKQVTFVCDPGFHLEGPTTRLCLASGNWSDSVPTCHKMCKEPVRPDNGWLVGEEYWSGQSVIVECKPGYWLEGVKELLCNENGTWSNDTPVCKSQEFYSHILLNNTEYYDLLRKWLAPVSGVPTKWVTCYRARENGWSASTFHSQCNGVGPTLTIIKCKQYIFGGYTDVSWHSSGSYSESANSFIFSLKNARDLNPFKIKVWRLDHAIYGNNDYGPTFGGGHDIHISNDAVNNENSYVNVGHSYIQVKGYRYGTSEARNLLAGTYNFRPDEVEVFKQTT